MTITTSVTYQFSGSNYANASAPFNTSMAPSGSLVTIGVLGNLTNVHIKSGVTSWSFTDGVNTYNPANSTIGSNLIVSTDPTGTQFIAYSLTIKLNSGAYQLVVQGPNLPWEVQIPAASNPQVVATTATNAPTPYSLNTYLLNSNYYGHIDPTVDPNLPNPFTLQMKPSGAFVTQAVLAPNLSNADITSQITYWLFNDGVNRYEAGGASSITKCLISTGPTGLVTGYSLVVALTNNVFVMVLNGVGDPPFVSGKTADGSQRTLARVLPNSFDLISG